MYELEYKIFSYYLKPGETELGDSMIDSLKWADLSLGDMNRTIRAGYSVRDNSFKAASTVETEWSEAEEQLLRQRLRKCYDNTKFGADNFTIVEYKREFGKLRAAAAGRVRQ